MASLPTQYQEYIYLSRYSRYLWPKHRRESWEETVTRYIDFFEKHLQDNHTYTLPISLRNELTTSVLSLSVMPSMRALSTAGAALDRDNVAGYNCAYTAIDNIRAFDEILYILMCGTGVGYSVERQYTSKLPDVAEDFYPTNTIISVRDSRVGWASAFKELLSLLYTGMIPKWDMSLLRPAGAPLKTFGGRSSGPEPLDELFSFTVELIKNAAGRKLTSIECHDLVCKVADVVVSGGVRRSALISLSNLSDDRMRVAKSGKWWEQFPHRALANNSWCATEKPDIGIFMDEWKSLYESKSGERGIFNRVAAQKQAAKSGRRDASMDFGCNPCSEIILRNKQFCNLTEVVVRAGDDINSLLNKVKIATILGTFQSTLTNFRYLSKKWKENCEEERLLGVSITGIMDCKLTNGTYSLQDTADVLLLLKEEAIKTNKVWAKVLGVNQSVAITCVKPSGTVSQLVDAASGIHSRHAPFYIRTVRADKTDPLAKMMVELGFPYENDVTKPDYTYVFSFPHKSPEGSVYRNDLTALQQLELWKVYQDNWCEHKPSMTVYVKEYEWLEVAAWVYRHFDEVSGVSFLPNTDHVYRQAPYQDATKEQYDNMVNVMPVNVNWSMLKEDTDLTEGSHNLACTAGVCEVVDLVK